MSVYRARAAPEQRTDEDCFAAATTKNDVQLIKLSIKTGHPVLIGLDGHNTIVKPVAEGDQAQSYEALYDTCYRTTDLERMQRAGVEHPSKVPLEVYRIEAHFELNALRMRLFIAVKGESNGDAVHRLRVLMETDIMLRASVHEEILRVIAVYLDNSEIPMRVASSTSERHSRPVDPPLDPSGPPWRILDEP